MNSWAINGLSYLLGLIVLKLNMKAILDPDFHPNTRIGFWGHSV